MKFQSQPGYIHIYNYINYNYILWYVLHAIINVCRNMWIPKVMRFSFGFYFEHTFHMHPDILGIRCTMGWRRKPLSDCRHQLQIKTQWLCHWNIFSITYNYNCQCIHRVQKHCWVTRCAFLRCIIIDWNVWCLCSRNYTLVWPFRWVIAYSVLCLTDVRSILLTKYLRRSPSTVL